MSYMLLTILVNVVEYWILIFIIRYICSARMKFSSTRIVLCTVVTGIISYAVFLTPSQDFVFSMFLMLALTVLLFSTRKMRDLLLIVPAVTVYFLLTAIPECILEELFPRFNTSFILDGNPVRIPSLVTDIALFVILLILRHVLIKYDTFIRLSMKEILGFVGLFFFSLIAVALLMAINVSNMSPFYCYLWKVIFAGAFVCGAAYYLFALIESHIRIYRQSLTRNETEYLRVQLNSLQDVKENEEQVRRLRHDLNNHISVIRSLCEDGNYEEIIEYTGHLKDEIALAGNIVLTGNKVADLVIRSKLKIAKEHSIDFTFNGSLEHLSTMDGPDICGLLANAYDNAIEACLPQHEPYIHTKVFTSRNYTAIQITNSVDKKVPIHDNQIASTKGEKESHGYGIKIMKQIAHKYGGKCTLHCNDKELTVKIVLPG